MSNFDDVKQFHDKFEIPRKDRIEFLKNEDMNFRIKFLEEEIQELKDGMETNQLHLVVDALIDIIWVAYGTADMMGLTEADWNVLWKDVVRANMSKERATDANDPRSTRKNKLDIVKPEGWAEPKTQELIDLLNRVK